ncbi:MAG: AAA family ATPase, partial [Methanomassiliicoccales archaeon]|nr:AAA family ATPase [Methanomassiliicoccales archaeon]
MESFMASAPACRPMMALSGTPGTGKTTVGQELARRGHQVIELHDFIESRGLLGKLDRKRRTREVDVGALDSALKKRLADDG